MRSDGEKAEDYYCPGEKPHEHEACTVQAFFILAVNGGRCLGPVGGGSASHGVEVSARGEKCESDKSKFKMESGQHGGFKLVNVATKLCLCQHDPGAGKMAFYDCDTAVCDLEKKDEALDGTFVLGPVGEKCITTSRRRGKTKKDIKMTGSADTCGGDGARFAFVKEGSLVVSGYAADVPAGAAKKKQPGMPFNPKKYLKPGDTHPFQPKGLKGFDQAQNRWYKDKSGDMLTDGDKLDGDHPTSHNSHPGVGWLDDVKIDFSLHDKTAVQTVNVGFLFKRDWQVKKPKMLKIQCSSDGTTYGNAAVFAGSDFDVPEVYYKSDEGGRKVMSFQVGDICGDDTTHFRLTVTPKGMNSGKNNDKDKKAVLDEVMAFAPFKFS
jgi:hypothetical protein